MIYFPGSATATTGSIVFDECFYFPAAVLMHDAAKRVSLEVMRKAFQTSRVNLEVR